MIGKKTNATGDTTVEVLAGTLRGAEVKADEHCGATKEVLQSLRDAINDLDLLINEAAYLTDDDRHQMWVCERALMVLLNTLERSK